MIVVGLGAATRAGDDEREQKAGGCPLLTSSGAPATTGDARQTKSLPLIPTGNLSDCERDTDVMNTTAEVKHDVINGRERKSHPAEGPCAASFVYASNCSFDLQANLLRLPSHCNAELNPNDRVFICVRFISYKCTVYEKYKYK